MHEANRTVLFPRNSSSIVVGPDGAGRIRYQIAGFLSESHYHNSASAWHDARRPQRVTQEGFLVPDSHYSPTVN